MEATERRLLNAKKASQFLSVSRSKLYQWIKDGKIKSIKVDGRRLFDVKDLDEFVEKLKKGEGFNE